MKMIDQEGLREQLHAFIQDDLLYGQEVKSDQELLLSGLVDSIGAFELVAKVEEFSGRSIPPEDVVVENFSSVDAILEYIKSHLGA